MSLQPVTTFGDGTIIGHVAERFETRARALIYARLAVMTVGLGAILLPSWRRLLGLALPEAAIGYVLLLAIHMASFLWVGRRYSRSVIFASLCADLLALTYLIAASGGISSPLMPTQVVYTMLFALVFPSPLAILPPLLTIPIVAAIDRLLGVPATSADILLVLWFTALNVAVVYVVVYLEGRERTALREVIRLQRDRRKQALDSQRTRIAREIHDGVGAALSSAMLQAEYLAGQPGPLADELLELRELTEEAMEELRRAVSILHREFQLESSIPAYVEAFIARHRLAGGCRVEGQEPALSADQQLMLFRILQEALANVGRHARADQVTVVLSFAQELATLEISDDGCGFRPDKDVSGHYGLRNMSERASKAGGALEIVSAPGQGTRIIATLPV